jgi:class 3 adenylate cyclase
MMAIAYFGILYPEMPGLLDRLRRSLASLASQLAALCSYGETRTQRDSSRDISILFTDIVGFSDLMISWPMEVVVASLDGYFERLGRCIYQYGGQVDKFIGDGMMAVFQSPDDAVNAARAIQGEVAHFNSQQTMCSRCSFPTRIVVDTGPVVRTALGLRRDRDRTVMGPVVNTASHLVKTLPPDKVFISHDTCCRLTGRGGLWLTVAQAMDRDGGRMAIYEVPALAETDSA